MFKCTRSLICLLVLTVIVEITGCSNGNTGNNGTGMNNNINTKNEVKISDLLLTDELRLWYMLESDESGTINYDYGLEDMFVCKNGNIVRYNINDTDKTEFTLETIDGMTDEEIITFVETTYGAVPVDENIEFLYTRDTSGNDIKEEILQFSSFEDEFRKRDFWNPGYTIERILEPQNILSDQYIGILESGGGHYPDALITKYDFKNDTKIILNDINDECMTEKD